MKKKQEKEFPLPTVNKGHIEPISTPGERLELKKAQKKLTNYITSDNKNNKKPINKPR
jgi:hypothetical protein